MVRWPITLLAARRAVRLAGDPLPFAVLLTVWAGSLVLAQILSFVSFWIDAQVEWKLLTGVRQRVYDHIQSLSLDFFTGEQTAR